MAELLLLPGDVFLSRNDGSWISRMVRKFTTGVGEPLSLVSHSGLVVAGADKVGGTLVIEALAEVRIRTLRQGYMGTGTKLAVWRPVFDTMGMLGVRAAQAALPYAGDNYGVWRIALAWGDWYLAKHTGKRDVLFFRKLATRFKGSHSPICSWLVSRAWESVLGQAPFGVTTDEYDPDDIYDYFNGPAGSKLWKQVWPEAGGFAEVM